MENEIILEEERQLSVLAEELQGSEIIKLAAEIKSKIAAGSHIYNFTIGDFNPEIFPIPLALEQEIISAYKNGETNYPPSNGIQPLRATLSQYLDNALDLKYSEEEILISGGARPLIYAAYQALLDRDEDALFPVPSWNNNHYTTLTGGNQIAIETSVENNFMPSADDLRPHISNAGLIALCSPLNPTGTVFSKESLEEIATLVVEENERRKGIKKPVYLVYDQIYWQLCHGTTEHHDPVNLVPEVRPYTVYIDGISKAFAATGVRVGWAFGPSNIIAKMKSILGHIGAWAPKPEQVATANFLKGDKSPADFMTTFKSDIEDRLVGFYKGLLSLKEEGLPIDVISPQAAIYLTLRIDLVGKNTPDGKEIKSVADTTAYLLDEAKLAIVPFSAFGASKDNSWYRLSVGTSKIEDIPMVISKLRSAITRLI